MWGLAGLCLVGSGWGSTPAHGADPIEPGDLSGRFRFVGGAAERRAQQAAIEALADEMNFLIRGYVRRKLEETNPIPTTLRYAVVPGGLSVEIPGIPVIVAPTDGSRVVWKDQFGERVRLQQNLSGRRLTQNFRGEQGSRTIVHRLSPDGQRLTFSVEIRSRHLPWPLRYRLSYRRTA